MKAEEALDAETLRGLLHYDPETGVFTWLVNRRRTRAGDVAGCKFKSRSSTYRFIGIYGRRYVAHRLAYLYMEGKWPPEEIDHIDGDGLNNKWSNLRPATHRQNMQNAKKRKGMKSPYKGVRYHKRHNKWYARIYANGENIHIGNYDTPEEARAAYCEAAREHFGEYARFE